MKKLILLVLAVGLLFAGCQKNPESGANPESNRSTQSDQNTESNQGKGNKTNAVNSAEKVKEITDALLGGGIFTETLEEIDSSMSYNLYGIDEADVVSAVVYKYPGASAEELAVIVCTDEKAADRIEERIEIYAENQEASFRSYDPIEAAKLDECEIIEENNIVVFVVSQFPDKAENIVESILR